jgi:protease IV
MICVGMVRPSRLAPLLVCAAAWSAGARAQFHRATDPVASPASALVLQDDALAVDVNPAAIGQLNGLSVALLHSEVDRAGSFLGRGDALYLAGRVIGPLGIGLSLQSIRPGDDAARPPGAGGVDRAMAALALSYTASASLSMGVATRLFASGNASFDGLTAFDASLLFRPNRWLSMSLLGRDLFVSRGGLGTAGLDLDASLMLSMALRPLPGQAVTISADLVSQLQRPLHVGARSGVAIEVPYVGTASGVIEVEHLGDSDAALRVMAELAIHAGQASVAGGVHGGDGFDEAPGWYAMVRGEAAGRDGLPEAARVLDIEIPHLSARGMLALTLALERARTEPRIAGVLLRPRGTDMGIAYAQELRMQIQSLRAAGKRVICHLDSASGSEYYACAAADRVLLDPAGDVRLLGIASSMMLFGEALQKLGVRADFIRIGPYKSAPEQLTQAQMSEAAREQVNTLLDDGQTRMYADLASDLRVSRERVTQIMDEGPYLAHAAVTQRLANATADEFELEDGSLDLFGDRALTRALPRENQRTWGRDPSLGIVVIEDEIVDGESVEVPLIGIHMTGAQTVVRELEQLGRDPSIRAIVLRVDSPGGAAMGSDKIWRAVRRLRKLKPVIASMGAIAASGGYYVASAADEIWADPGTLTGSIGIFYGKVDVEQLAAKLGVHVESFARGRRAGAESNYRPFTDDERAALTDVLRGYYRMFLARVAEGRNMSVEAVDAVARGRVHSGDAARRLGLVDRLGGLASALIRARQLAQLPAEAGVVVRPLRPTGLLDYVLGGKLSAAVGSADAALEAPAAVVLPRELQALLAAMITVEQLEGGSPLALLPFGLQL